jgi:RimJ/RimL family protein N-acetyltransferase
VTETRIGIRAGNEPSFDRLESERIAVRRFKDSDLEPFLAYRNDPGVVHYQAWESCNEREVLDFIREMRSSEPGTPSEWFQFAVELKETEQLIGNCRLKTEEDGRQAEIGITLPRQHQGKGYASEAVSHLLAYAFGNLGLHRIVAIADKENTPSEALLERLGMHREGSFVQNAWVKGHWTSKYLYAILRDQWLRERQQGGTVVQNLKIIFEPQASPEDTAIIRDGLVRFNVAETRHTYYSPVAIFLRDDRGAVLGGALGDVWEAGSASRSSGWRSRSAARATGSGSCGPPKTRRGRKDAGASIWRPLVPRHACSTNVSATRSSRSCWIVPPGTPPTL